MSQPTSDEELFDDNFGEWLEAHGVTLHRTPVESNGFHATIDLNTLKAAILARDAAIRQGILKKLERRPDGNASFVAGYEFALNKLRDERRESDQAKEEG